MQHKFSPWKAILRMDNKIIEHIDIYNSSHSSNSMEALVSNSEGVVQITILQLETDHTHSPSPVTPPSPFTVS